MAANQVARHSDRPAHAQQQSRVQSTSARAYQENHWQPRLAGTTGWWVGGRSARGRIARTERKRGPVTRRTCVVHPRPLATLRANTVLLSSQFWPLPPMSRRVINSTKLCLSHSFNRIKWTDQWVVGPHPVLTSTTSAIIGKTAIATRWSSARPAVRTFQNVRFLSLNSHVYSSFAVTRFLQQVVTTEILGVIRDSLNGRYCRTEKQHSRRMPGSHRHRTV